ncbi:MAG: alkaline phosphatase family protein [Trueperaceae bacterium]
MPPVILIMLDGISADAVARHPARLPHLRSLAARGLQVDRVAADLPATSLPGRTSILTGVGADVHGVYGNVIWDGERFRYANPDDVRAPTLPQRALAAGLDVAVLGYGMVRPEDATTFHHAWWANEMLQRARDLEPIPADEGWLRTSRWRDASGRLAALAAAGLPDGVPDAYASDRMHYFMSELTGDQTMLQWTAALAAGADPPDLIVTEVLTPDSVQHVVGTEHPFALWSLSYADALVGEVLRALDAAGRLETTSVVVTSDHGHGPVDGALYLDALLPGATTASEGGVAYVAVDGERDVQNVAKRLEAHGVERLPGDHLPPERRDQLAAFVVPDRAVGFEASAPAERAGATSGPSRYVSGHGFAPGTASDERFLIAAGGAVPARRVPRAASEDVAATVAALLELGALGDGDALI